MFAPLHYLHKLKKFFDIHHELVVKQVTDSESLILRITKGKKNKPISAREYMKSEMDLEMQILYTLQKLNPISHELHHVKGHQDRTKKLEDLTWEEKMNVYCDQIATKELKKIEIPIRIVPLLKASHIKMDMHNVTLTHHLASQIRNRHSKVGIQKRLSEKYKWNYQLQRKIDMDSFRQNFTSFTCT